jgi:hypothetical protein
MHEILYCIDPSALPLLREAFICVALSIGALLLAIGEWPTDGQLEQFMARRRLKEAAFLIPGEAGVLLRGPLSLQKQKSSVLTNWSQKALFNAWLGLYYSQKAAIQTAAIYLLYSLVSLRLRTHLHETEATITTRNAANPHFRTYYSPEC